MFNVTGRTSICSYSAKYDNYYPFGIEYCQFKQPVKDEWR